MAVRRGRGKPTTQALPQALGMPDGAGGLKAREKGHDAAQGEEGRLEHDLTATGPFISSQPHGPLWKNYEIMEGGSKRSEKKWDFDISSKTHCNKVSRTCPDMVTISKGRTRHCCPNKQDKQPLTPRHLPDLQVGRAVQKPSPPRSQAIVNW